LTDRVESDAAPWRHARSISDLGELGARWLGGDLRWSPRYQAATSDEETVPLIPMLAEINRLGFWTTMTQPGLFSGSLAQRAYISGYCTEATANAIQGGLLASDLLAVALPATIAGDSSLQVPITRDGMSESTWGGAFEAVDEWRDDLGDDVVAVIKRAWAVGITDLTWGRQDVLWPALLGALRERPQRRVATYLLAVWGRAPDGVIFADE
jgi:hypothetical protein